MLFDRIKYKNFSKTQLKGRYKIPVLMMLVTFFVLTLASVPSIFEENKFIESFDDLVLNYSFDLKSFLLNLSDILVSLLIFIFGFAFINVFIKMSKSPNPVKFSDFIEGFEMWGKSILAGLWQSLWIYLWSLLFIIPGIVKSYAYSQNFYLLCEYKNLSVTKALKISMKLTNGHKWDLFILDLSFIGWVLLSCITCGIALFYVVPYYEMTKVNAYHALLKEAVEKGIIVQKDLNS